MSEKILENLNNSELDQILSELDELELELADLEKIEKEYGFVFSSGGGSRPRITA